MGFIKLSEISKKEDLKDVVQHKGTHSEENPDGSETDGSRRPQLAANQEQLFQHVTSLGQLELMRKYAPCHPMPNPDEPCLNYTKNENDTQTTGKI